MRPPTRLQTRRLAGCLWLLLIAGGCHLRVSGQEYLPLVDAGAVTRVEQRTQPLRRSDGGFAVEDAGNSGWDASLAVTAVYDDNIFLSATAKESDVVMIVVPEIAYTAGKPAADKGAYIRFAYRPAVVLYQANSGENRIDHDAAVTIGWQGKAIAAAYDGRFRRLGDATADTGTTTERNEYESMVRVAWYPRDKMAVEVGGDVNGTNYDNSLLHDSRGTFGEVALRYAYSPKTQFGVAYRIGRLDVDGAGAQTAQQAVAQFAWQPRAKIAVDLEAGVEHRSYDLGSESRPVAEARIKWLPREGTELYLSGYLREEASGFFSGQNYHLAGASAGISESLGGGWTAQLEGGYERASYHRVSGSGPANRVDEIYFVRPALDYALSDHFRAGIFYQYSRNRSNRRVFSYDDHQVGVRFEYQF